MREWTNDLKKREMPSINEMKDKCLRGNKRSVRQIEYIKLTLLNKAYTPNKGF
jgi:hypothetical protein